MFIFAKESKKGVKIFVPKKKFFEKKVTGGSLNILKIQEKFALDSLDLSSQKEEPRIEPCFFERNCSGLRSAKNTLLGTSEFFKFYWPQVRTEWLSEAE